MKWNTMRNPVIVAATHVKELKTVELFDNEIRFGASVTLRTLDDTLQHAIAQLHGL